MNGFLPALLLTEAQVYQGTVNPSTKITPLGYLKMLLDNGIAEVVNNSVDNGGHTRTVTVKYIPRGVAGKSTTQDDCTIQATPDYMEFTVPSLNFRKNGTFIADDKIRLYETEASRSVLIGKPVPPNGIFAEFYNTLIRKANGLLQDVDKDLLLQQAASFGVNATTGLATSKTINFPLNTTNNPLDQGMTKLETDIQENEIIPENSVIVGSGYINGVYRQIQRNTQNTNRQNYPINAPDYHWDSLTNSAWGANQFGIFEKGAVKFINVPQFSGNFGGDRLSSWTFTLQLPLIDSDGNSLSSLEFDAQLWYNKCPADLEIDNVTQRVGRGWVLDLMIRYAQFNIPGDAYDPADRMYGGNGTLRYVGTNS
jgi:hypothetical protein